MVSYIGFLPSCGFYQVSVRGTNAVLLFRILSDSFVFLSHLVRFALHVRMNKRMKTQPVDLNSINVKDVISSENINDPFELKVRQTRKRNSETKL